MVLASHVEGQRENVLDFVLLGIKHFNLLKIFVRLPAPENEDLVT